MPDVFDQRRLGRHGGDRRSKEFQGGNKSDVTTLKPSEKNTRAHVLARLDRDYPDLAARVRSNEASAHAIAIELGWRRPPTRSQESRKRFDVASLIG
jgi:hypothetical protein